MVALVTVAHLAVLGVTDAGYEEGELLLGCYLLAHFDGCSDF